MAETQAFIGYGTLVQRGDGAVPEVFTTIAEVTNVEPPDDQTEMVEVTHMESPGRYRERIPGLQDGGEFSCTINFLPSHATHNATTGLLKDKQARTKRNYRIVFPDGLNTTASFAAYVMGFKPSAPVDGAVTADVSFQVAGNVVWS